jgi:hypothetical protein
MPNIADKFFFDVNFNLGDDSVFTLSDTAMMPPLPPIEGFLLILNDNTPFLLLNATLAPNNQIGLL